MTGIKSLLFLALALPTTVFAGTQIVVTNSGGTLTGSSTGLTLTGSHLIAIKGLNGGGLLTGDLGSVSFTTSALVSGTLQMGGTFAAGGTFTITANGTDGVQETLFSGTFSGPVDWTLVELADGTHAYTLTGTVSGSTASGLSVTGVLVQLTVNTDEGFFDGTVSISGGETNIVPES